MTHPERVEDYLEHIADAIERALRYCGNLGSLQALEQNEQAQDAIVRTIAVVGEAASRICKVAPAFVTNHPELPWRPDARHSQQGCSRLLRCCVGHCLEYGEG